MKTVKPDQVQKLIETYEEGLLDSVGALDEVLVDYVEERMAGGIGLDPNCRLIPGDAESDLLDLNDAGDCECYIMRTYGDFYAADDPIQWDKYADIFNFNQTANDGFWAHWNSLFECTTCGESSDEPMVLYECANPNCIESMCENCLTVRVFEEHPLVSVMNHGLVPNRSETEEILRPACLKCYPDARKATEDDFDELF